MLSNNIIKAAKEEAAKNQKFNVKNNTSALHKRAKT